MGRRPILALALSLTASAALPQTASLPTAEGTSTLASTSAAPSSAEAREDQERLAAALRRLAPQRPGIVDAYVVSVALDGDPVFGREARVAGDVLQRRYDAAGRTIVLAGTAGGPAGKLAHGSPANLERVVARLAELMNEEEDVLVLYTTSHGTPLGITYRYIGSPPAAISPQQLRDLFERHGLRNRLLIVSACFSGVFIPALQSPASVIVTAASRARTSFGCVADSDWTFFGDAMINRALRKPQPLGAAFAEASSLVSEWEERFQVVPSQPQIFLGASATRWLSSLERRMPRSATEPVGRPAVETSGAVVMQQR